MEILAFVLIITGLVPIVKLLIKIIFCGYKETEGYIVDYSKTESWSVSDNFPEEQINNIIEFMVENKTYRCIDNSGNKSSLNSKVKVLYDPKDPTKCVAKVKVYIESIYFIVAGIVVYLFTSYII